MNHEFHGRYRWIILFQQLIEIGYPCGSRENFREGAVKSLNSTVIVLFDEFSQGILTGKFLYASFGPF